MAQGDKPKVKVHLAHKTDAGEYLPVATMTGWENIGRNGKPWTSFTVVFDRAYECGSGEKLYSRFIPFEKKENERHGGPDEGLNKILDEFDGKLPF